MPLEDFRSVFMPYCLQREGKFWRVLNREYRPVGNGKGRYREGWPTLVKLYPAQERRLRSAMSKNDVNRMWLYDDGCIPTSSVSSMKRYLELIAVLMKAKAVAAVIEEET